MADPRTESVAEAQRAAGYRHHPSACRTLQLDIVKRAIEERKRERRDKTRPTVELIERTCRRLARQIERATQDETTIDLGQAIQALAILAKVAPDLREMAGPLTGNDEATRERCADWIQRYTITVIRCTLDRPTVAHRIMARAATACGVAE
jgi:hypothetical protein